MAYPNKKCTFANRVVRRSKSQNISALALSLNRYHKSATPPFYSDIQSDTSFLIIHVKERANRTQKPSLLEFFVERGENSVAGGTGVRCPENSNPLPIEKKNVAHGLEKRRATLEKTIGNVF